jgi:ferredoxin--NADP+ reductase
MSTADILPQTATLLSSRRITPAGSPEEVRCLRFATGDAGFDARPGQCLRVLAPGQFGQRWHERLYSIAELDQADPRHTGFTLLVRRCQVIDDFNGERYAGVASSYLCDLPVGGEIRFTGPVGHPFPVPEDRDAGLLMIGMGTGIAPFRGLVRRIYEEVGAWRGRVRLFYGARSGLEMLYMNEENADLALYYDQPTFQAFRAVSPKPHFGAPPALDRALVEHAAEVWAMLQEARTHLFLAGPQALLPPVERALAEVAGSAEAWAALRAEIQGAGRWHEVLY